LLNELVLMLHCLMINDEWSVIRGVLCPPRARSMSRGKPSISLTFDRKEVMKPEMIPSPLPISKSAATGVVSMISESTATQFSSIISVSVEIVLFAMNQCSLPKLCCL
jgi:hypothetical protein